MTEGLVDLLRRIAQRKNATPPQIALDWCSHVNIPFFIKLIIDGGNP
jgi:aryl-alcohol dehydrogenase-like predicted oxidoreductase